MVVVSEHAADVNVPDLSSALFNIRELPSSNARILGQMNGQSTRVSVTDKVKSGGYIWYRITLGEALGALPAGTQGWVRSEGVVASTSWPSFKRQLHTWEAAHAAMNLSQRITKLRQMCHSQDLPFDSVIGVDAGREYLDDRRLIRSEWQLLKDSQIVRMPDGSQVDVYHLLVGLDVLPAERRQEDQTYLGFAVGQNYSAATWSGDIGAGVADALLRQDADWERAMIPATMSEAEQTRIRTEHYYTTRAPEADLLGDVDAWGVDALRSEPNAPTTIEGLLTSFYEGTSPAPGGAVVTTRRRSAIERFLAHYRFHTDSPLREQAAPCAAMQVQIETFARMWVRNRQLFRWGTDGLEALAAAMTLRFLNWLDQLACSNSANVPDPTAPKK